LLSKLLLFELFKLSEAFSLSFGHADSQESLSLGFLSFTPLALLFYQEEFVLLVLEIFVALNDHGCDFKICILPSILVFDILIEIFNTLPILVLNEKCKIDDHQSWRSADTRCAVKIHLLVLDISKVMELNGSAEEVIAVLVLFYIRD
jgi:hypothetical protein